MSTLVSNRRNFLKLGGLAATTAVVSPSLGRAMAASCGLTPAQTPGPFYPGETLFREENDLTVSPIDPLRRAKGQEILIVGQVVDGGCAPVAGVNVEIWQACATGRYNNPNDPNPSALDPDFRYWGETTTDANGRYLFRSIRPGAYPADTDWWRPPHVHFKLSRLGYKELVTQMYFKGQPYNDQDLILRDVPASQRDSVIIDFVPSSDPSLRSALTGTFNITIAKVR